MRYIPLTQGLVALVDDSDYDRVMQHKWWATRVKNRFYAMRHVRISPNVYRKGLLHRFILNAKPGQQIDHVNGDTLDCRYSNLRFATNGENQRNRGKHHDNTSGYKGVDWHKQRSKWRARIMIDSRYIELGHFDTPEAAAHAYDKAAIEYHGAFARTNLTQD